VFPSGRKLDKYRDRAIEQRHTQGWRIGDGNRKVEAGIRINEREEQ
jgi:hypothetical protein